MNTKPFLLEETNLSNAWCKVLKHAITEPSGEISPLVLTLTGFDESLHIKEVVDCDLKRNKKTSIDTVSETIFPESLYELCKRDRNAFYNEYIANLPRIREIDSSNGRGTYFERLIAYDGNINQLETIIKSISEDPVLRRSKLQAGIFDPREDHLTGPYQRFPCLQHVTFYVSKQGGLVLNSFYAIQFFYQKAYGNWLGLINLGKFVARETGLKLERFNCTVGVETLGITKTQAQNLLACTNVVTSSQQT